MQKCIADTDEIVPTSAHQTEIDDAIRRFGAEHRVNTYEIDICVKLAYGYNDIVILLERPLRMQDCSASFDDFVKESRTLSAIDELLRFASKNRRNVANVCVLDAFTFKPKGLMEPSVPERCARPFHLRP